MSVEYISTVAAKLRRRYDGDPFRLCVDTGIILSYSDMGSFSGACKGFYLVQSRKQIIMLNSSLPEELRPVILAHEIGHAVLHRKETGLRAFHEFAVFDQTSRMEYEANLFAAEFLMRDEDVLELLNGDMSFFQAARELGVPAELLDFKFRVLKRRGYQVVDPPMVSQGTFLKHLRGFDA